MYENPIATLRQMKGAPLSILIALTIVQPRHVSSSWLCGCTGYASDSVTQATWYLKEMGFIECDSRRTNWRLSEGVQQLPLPDTMLPAINQDPEKPDLDATATTAFKALNTMKVVNRDEAAAEALNESGSGKTGSGLLLDVLHNAGIGDPTAQLLADLDHITLDYANAHINKAKQESIPTGLLIHRMQSGDPEPYLPDPDDRQSYVTGEFADHINH